VRTVRNGPVIGLIAQVVLLAVLAGTVGLGAAGWLTGTAYGVFVCVALTLGLHRSGAATLGPADRVTLARAILVGGVAALTVDSFGRPVPVVVLATLTAVALALDGVDGQVARRTGTCSPLGARFDMEVDAFLLLVLSLYAARPVGAWVLAIGAMRYAFVLGIWTLPWMRGTLPPRFWRKVVAAVQGVALVTATAGVLPLPLTVAGLAVALTLLVESFGRDVVWLWQHRPVTVGHRMVRHRTVRPGTGRHSTVRHNAGRHDVGRPNISRHNVVRHRPARRGAVTDIKVAPVGTRSRLAEPAVPYAR
jgi:phosphatidylglycerophosphate synthase